MYYLKWIASGTMLFWNKRSLNNSDLIFGSSDLLPHTMKLETICKGVNNQKFKYSQNAVVFEGCIFPLI